MKNKFYAIIVSLLLVAPVQSAGISGKIVEMKAHDENYMGGGSSWDDRTWITIENVTSIGSECVPRPWSNGLAPLFLDSSGGMFSLVLAAKMADKEVQIEVNTSIKQSHACKIEYVGIK